MAPESAVFLAYPGAPRLLAETMRAAARKIEQRSQVVSRTWEDLKVDGRVIIGEVLSHIDAAKVLVAEIGSLNPNVMFEVGYAILRETVDVVT